MSTLQDLYQIHRPSKYDFFIPVFERHFSAIRNSVTKVLEIGVQYGNCLRMFRDYFPNAQIYGLDISDRYEGSDRDRITTFLGNSGDKETVDTVMSQIGDVDIVIDDGGHYPEPTIRALEYFFPYVKSGGVYAIEDLGASYWEDYGGSYLNRKHLTPITTVEYLKGMVDAVNSDCWHSEFKTPWGESTRNHPARRQDNVEMSHTYFDDHVSSVHFYPMLALIDKR